MSIADQITRLSNAKAAIKTSIENKGVTVGDDVKLDGYPALIDNIEVGGGGETHINPDFYELRTQNGTNYDNLFRGYNGPDIDVSEWDTSKVTSAQHCFADCKKSIDISNWDLSSLTNATYMFGNCSATINGIQNMDLISLTNAYEMFYSFTNGNKYIDLSVLDFSNVSNVNYMFQYSNTDFIDVRNINLTGTSSYNYLFYQCSGTEIDLSAWDISRVTILDNLSSFSNFKKINLTGWNTVNVTNMSYCFYYISSLETLIIPDWDMTNATSTSSFIGSVPKLKYIDLSRSNDFTINTIATMLPTKTQAAYGEVLVPADTSQDVINAVTAKYWKPIGPKLDLTSTELVLELDEVKPGKTTKVWTGNNDPWYGDDRLESIEFISSDESVATINGREIISTGIEGTTEIICRRREDGAVLGSTTLTVSETDSKPNLIKFRTDGSESIYYNIITVNETGLTNSKLTKDAAGIYSYDPGTQITSIKFGPYTTEIVKLNFNEANITNMENMFESYKGETLDLSDLDTSKVTTMYKTFENCYYLKEVIGEIDMSNVAFEKIDRMFNYCYELETVYLKNIFKNTNPKYTFSAVTFNLEYTKIKDECLVRIINELPDLYSKGYPSYNNVSIKLPPTNTLTAEQVQPAIDKGWTVVNCNF